MLCQRHNSVLISTREPRDLEELEGTLLDPDALTRSQDLVVINRLKSGNNLRKRFDPEESAVVENAYVRQSSPLEDGHGHPYRSELTPLQVSMSCAEEPQSKAAVPSEYFQYNELKDNNKHDCNDSTTHTSVSPRSTAGGTMLDKEGASNRHSFFPSNLNLNTYSFEEELGISTNTPEAHAISTAAKARLGSNKGRMNALEEKERIKAINRQVRAKPYHEKVRIDAAKKIARDRVRKRERTFVTSSSVGVGIHFRNPLGKRTSSGSTSAFVDDVNSSAYYTKPSSLLERKALAKRGDDSGCAFISTSFIKQSGGLDFEMSEYNVIVYNG